MSDDYHSTIEINGHPIGRIWRCGIFENATWWAISPDGRMAVVADWGAGVDWLQDQLPQP
jgi:hypothetical protein